MPGSWSRVQHAEKPSRFPHSRPARSLAGDPSRTPPRDTPIRDSQKRKLDPSRLKRRPDNANDHSLEWNALLKRAGVREVPLHDARHSAAPCLLMQGVDPRTTMASMGWSHVELTDRYQHAVMPARSDAANRLQALLWPDIDLSAGAAVTRRLAPGAFSLGPTSDDPAIDRAVRSAISERLGPASRGSSTTGQATFRGSSPRSARPT